MLNNTFEENAEFNDYNFIQGNQLTEEELNKINFLINFDYQNKTEHEIYFIIQHNTGNIFNDISGILV
jgi:hypothetical protein